MTAVPPEDPDRPLTSEEVETWSMFVTGGWALFARVNDELSVRGLSAGDMRVLEALARAPHLGISELAETISLHVSTVSRQIARLITDGDVERIKSPADGRHRLVRLTERGQTTLAAHARVRDRVVRERVVDVLSAAEFAALGAVFRKINDGILDTAS